MTDGIVEDVKEVEPDTVKVNGAGVEVGSQASLSDIRKMETLLEQQKTKGK